MIFYEFIPIKIPTKSQKSSCQRHVSDMLAGNPRSSDRLTFVKTQDLIEDERVSRVSYILEILETWKPDSNVTIPFIPCFLETSFSPQEIGATILRQTQRSEEFEDGKPIESYEVIPSLIIENTGGFQHGPTK